MEQADVEVQAGAADITATHLASMAQITVSARIPDFWTDQPRLWFVQTEAILAPQKLGEEPKYNLVVAKLGKEVITQITDFLSKPPEKNRYTLLKERLLQVFEESETRKLQKLIGEMELGDQRPSQLMTKMKDLARGKVSEEALSLLWQGHLPTAVRAVLAVADTKDLVQQAKLADKIVENIQPTHVAEVCTNQGESSSVLTEIAKINARLDNLTASSSGYRRNNNRRFRSRSRSSPGKKRSPNSPDWLCFYHYRYRTKANKCVKPCSWKDKSEN